MKSKTIGKLDAIYRYPVKSFAGERLESSRVENYGLYGDRCYAFVDHSKEGWDRFITARKVPEMLGYKAELIDEYTGLSASPKVKISNSDGTIYSWDANLLEHMQQYVKPIISLETHSFEDNELKAVDEGSILIVTNQALRHMESLIGDSINAIRFRPNLIMTISDEISESELLGRTIMVGETELTVNSFCERCSMINIDPHSLAKTPVVLKTVFKDMNQLFGMYASVARPGVVSLNDPIQLIES